MNSAPGTGVWIFPNDSARQLVDAVALAEELGLDEFWLGDEGPAREPLTVLAAAAEATSSIKLATGITNPYVRHPVLTTTAMLTVHELSEGRALLGVGAGGYMSLAPLGLTADRPVATLERFLKLARAVAAGEAADGYAPPDVAITAAVSTEPMPIFVGARGERLNRLASRLADGVFVAGLPPFRYDDVVGWGRSVRPIDVAIYPSAAFTDEDIDRHRPEMIWSLLDCPPEVRAELGLDMERIRTAAEALRAGDAAPARAVLTDDLLDQVMLLGSAERVGGRLADLVRRFRPQSIGLALVLDDLMTGIETAARCFEVMTALLEARAGDDP